MKMLTWLAWFLFPFVVYCLLAFFMFEDVDQHYWEVPVLFFTGHFLGWLEGRRYVG